MSKAPKAIVLNPADDVAVITCRDGVQAGDEVAGIETLEAVARGHKVARRPIKLNELVHKLGHVIGRASKDIPAGAWVHTHNIEMPPNVHQTTRFDDESRIESLESLPDTFDGYTRPNGQTGTRNVILAVASVNCSATVVKAICRAADSAEFHMRVLIAPNL